MVPHCAVLIKKNSYKWRIQIKHYIWGSSDKRAAESKNQIISNWTSQSRIVDTKKERRAVSFLLRGDKEWSLTAAGLWWRVYNAHRRLNGVIGPNVESQHCDGINCFQITSVWTSGFKLGMDYVVYCSGLSRSLVSRCCTTWHLHFITYLDRL